MRKSHCKKNGKFCNGVKLIGITGSIGAGKTTVAGFFKKLGAHVIDADKLVHKIYHMDSAVRKKILEEFGEPVFTRNRIDRKKLARVAFSGRKRLRALCDIVYPETIKRIKEEVGKAKEDVVVLDAPMLIEAGLGDYVDYVIVVRRSVRPRARKRLAFQMPLSEKMKRADFTIDNNRAKKYTRKKVEDIWQKL